MAKQILLSSFIFVAFLTTGYSQGFISETIQHDGLAREYSIYIPESYDGTADFPLLFNFHGGNDVIASWQLLADMRQLSDNAGFILVYPQARPDPSDGNSRNWLPKIEGTFDDVPFVSAMIDAIADEYKIDQNRIYACGYSLGGEFSYELACRLNDRIAAIGAVARTMQADPSSYCIPDHPTGVLTILGTDDTISPYDGLTWGGIEYYISATETHEYWADHNSCNSTPTVSIVSPSVERYTWSTESGCAYVEELKVLGGGHDWPGIFGNMTIDASEEIWQFVSRYDTSGLIDCTTSSTTVNSPIIDYTLTPNPFHEELTIELALAQENKFSIYTMMGELVRQGTLDSRRTTINLSSLTPNVYLLTMGDQCTKIVKTDW